MLEVHPGTKYNLNSPHPTPTLPPTGPTCESSTAPTHPPPVSPYPRLVAASSHAASSGMPGDHSSSEVRVAEASAAEHA